jgi:hypothetical protein
MDQSWKKKSVRNLYLVNITAKNLNHCLNLINIPNLEQCKISVLGKCWSLPDIAFLGLFLKSTSDISKLKQKVYDFDQRDLSP